MISLFYRVPTFWPDYPGLLTFLKAETQGSDGFRARFGQGSSFASVG